jgi:hypothetical protein
MQGAIGENAELLVEMLLLALMIAAAISLVFLLAYIEVELGGFRAAWRLLQSPTATFRAGDGGRSSAVTRAS